MKVKNTKVSDLATLARPFVISTETLEYQNPKIKSKANKKPEFMPEESTVKVDQIDPAFVFIADTVNPDVVKDGTSNKNRIRQKKQIQTDREFDPACGLTKLVLPEDYEFVVAMRNLACEDPSDENLKEEKVQVRLDLYTLIANYHDEDISQVSEVKKLERRFTDLGTFIESELKLLFNLTYKNKETNYRPTNEPYKGLRVSPDLRPAILDALIIASWGYSTFIWRILEKGPKDKRFNDVIQFLKSLDTPDLESFLYHAEFIPDKKNDNLAKALLGLTDSKKVLRILYKSARDSLADENDENFSPHCIENKQLLYLTAMKNYEDCIFLDELKEQFIQAISSDVLNLVCTVIKERYTKEAEDLFLAYAKEGPDTLSMREDCKRALVIRHYVSLVGEKAIPEIKEILKSNYDNPMVVLGAAEALLSLQFTEKKGVAALEELINEDFEASRPSMLLATIIYHLGDYFMFNDLFIRLLVKPIDIASELVRFQDSRLSIVGKQNIFLFYELARPDLPQMLEKLDLGNTFGRWVLDKEEGGLTILGENSRKLLLRALEIEKELQENTDSQEAVWIQEDGDTLQEDRDTKQEDKNAQEDKLGSLSKALLKYMRSPEGKGLKALIGI